MMERSKKRNAGENVPKSFELELITKNGEYKTIEIGTETIEVNNQKSILGIVRDITDRKNMEIEIQKGKELAEKSAEIANTILNNLGHELRTPLNGILGFSRILRSEISDEDHNEMLRLIEISGERLKKTLGTLLILTELDSEKYRIILEKCNLKSIVNDYDMSTIDQVKVKDIKYRIIIEDDNLCIKSDQYLLQQAIYNILDNAYKFTEQGNITLKVYKETEKAVIEISDTGIGIEEEKLNIIYEPFRQVSEGIQRKYEGVGIGLTIVQRILEQINGNIEIESKVNVGTTIRLIFDCCNE
jgi:signal transduction histidine kinase